MKTLVRSLLGLSRTKTVASAEAASYDSRDNPLTIEDNSENATRRQLVQVLLRDVLRKSGIPAHWIECQMLLVSSRTRGHGMYVRLVVKHWDERLMNYAFAFQQTLLTDIERFEPKASEWLHGISWQLEMQDNCPYTKLPDKSFWQEAVKKPAAPSIKVIDSTPLPAKSGTQYDHSGPAFQSTATDHEGDTARDLERLFAIRDQELERQAAEGLAPVGYEKTQPALL